MKLLSAFVLILSFCFFTNCSKQTDSENKIDNRNKILCKEAASILLTIPCDADLELTAPNCLFVQPLQGIDTYVGRLTSTSEEIEINYDIGELAGNYVNSNSTSKIIEQAINLEFWHEVRDDKLYITFPAAGPANFYTSDIEFFDSIIEIMKTVALK